jgi:chromosome segregation ATPase
MIRQWLFLSSVAFGIGFGISLPFNRDFKQSSINGLVAIPASAAVLWITRRQQHQLLSQELTQLKNTICELEIQKQSISASVSETTATSAKIQQKIEIKQLELDNLQNDIQSRQAQLQVESAKLCELEQLHQEQQIKIVALDTEKQTIETQLQSAEQDLKATLVEQQRQMAQVSSLHYS